MTVTYNWKAAADLCQSQSHTFIISKNDKREKSTKKLFFKFYIFIYVIVLITDRFHVPLLPNSGSHQRVIHALSCPCGFIKPGMCVSHIRTRQWLASGRSYHIQPEWSVTGHMCLQRRQSTTILFHMYCDNVLLPWLSFLLRCLFLLLFTATVFILCLV